MKEDQAARSLAALGSSTRLRVFRTLVRVGSDGLNVGALQAKLEIPGSTLAHHLSALVQAGLVVQERQGREVVSRVDYLAMHRLLAFLTEECCADAVFTRESDAA